jgi:hypothetical protein
MSVLIIILVAFTGFWVLSGSLLWALKTLGAVALGLGALYITAFIGCAL